MKKLVLFFTLMFLAVACTDKETTSKDDANTTDTNTANGDSNTGTDSATGTDSNTGTDAAGTDTNTATDTPADTSFTQPDLTPGQCFDFSDDPDIPLAIDGVFDSSSTFWRRPHDDTPVCPASGLLPATAALVPVVAYAFCNNTSEAHTYDFEMAQYTGPNDDQTPLDDPYLILYSGQTHPADVLGCLAINDDIPDAIDATDSLIEGITVQPGESVLMVGTTVTYGTDGTGQGNYLLIVGNVD